ncbi:MAG: hypothetical protein RLZZ350_2563 [Verrucomicrobiota bacterium]|jgi:hypothetical protein
MTPSQIIMQEPIPWWFYVFMVGFVAIVGWMGFIAIRRLRALFLIGPFRKLAQEASVLTKAVSIVTWYSAVLWTALVILVVCGTWVIVRANFCSFRQLDVTDSSMRLSYEFSFLNREFTLSSVRSVALVHIIRRKFGLEIATTDGRVFRSMDTDDEAVVSDCRDLVVRFQRTRSNHALQPTPVGAGSSAFAVHVTGPAWLSLGR